MNKHVPPKAIVVPDPGEPIAVMRSLEEAVDAFRMMKARLGLTNEFLENVYGFAKGHADKVLGRSETKRLGYDTFRLFCEVFAVEFRMHVDLEQVKRMEAIWEERVRPPYPPDCKPGRVSKKIIAMAKPHVIKDLAKAGGTASGALRTGSQGSEIMRKVAKSRWRKHRRKIRCVAEMKRSATIA